MDQSIIFERKEKLVYVVVQQGDGYNWVAKGVNSGNVHVLAVFSTLRDANNFIATRSNHKNLVIQTAEMDPFSNRIATFATNNVDRPPTYIS